MQLVVVGRIGAPYGVKGWVKVKSYTEPREQLLNYLPWTVRLESKSLPVLKGREKDRQVRLKHHKKHQDGFVVALEGIDDRDDVGRLSGSEVLVDAALFPELALGEYYWRTLIGMQVVNQAGLIIGKVKYLLETGVHDVLVVKNEQDETLIPFDSKYVKDVDVQNTNILVAWDPGW